MSNGNAEDFARRFADESLEGLRIKGFGPEDPPAPTYPALAEDETDFDPIEHDIPTVPQPPPSPLVALGQKSQQKGERETIAPTDGLLVMGSLAAYKGQNVELLESEQGSIARIILEAAQRRLRGHLAEVKRQAPKRAKKAKPKAPEAVQAQPEKKRRGRPPKVKPVE